MAITEVGATTAGKASADFDGEAVPLRTGPTELRDVVIRGMTNSSGCRTSVYLVYIFLRVSEREVASLYIYSSPGVLPCAAHHERGRERLVGGFDHNDEYDASPQMRALQRHRLDSLPV